MDAEKLVFMANKIAAYFRAYPENDAIIGIRDHIKLFWTPGMRRTLEVHLLSGEPSVEHLVVAAMTEPRPPGESPILKEAQGPGRLGELVSDAG